MGNRGNKKMKKGARIALGILAVLLVLACVGGFFGYRYYQQAMAEAAAMKERGRALKNELKTVVSDIENKDYDGAEISLENMRVISADIRTELDEKDLWQLVKRVPKYSDQIESIYVMLDVVDEAADSLITPLINEMRAMPNDQLKVGDGFNVAMMRSYIDFAENMEPVILSMADKLADTDFSFIDSEGKINEYRDKLLAIASRYDDLKADINVLKAIIGDGSNRYYIFGAQNTSEIRAAGGFVGAVGTIVVYDGVLYVGDFQTVYNVMSVYTQESANLTQQELNLFSNFMVVAWDSEYNPDFRRVAEIWSTSYEAYNGVYVDGVISMTPVMIQRLLHLTGSEIYLSDGTVLNGDNATKAIEYDLYHKYFNIYSYTDYSNDICDALFAEAAKGAMASFTDNFKMSKIMDYYDMFRESAADRTLMIWMKDAQEEQYMIDAGVSGVLNPGTNNAVAGVYLSTHDPSKLGIFACIDTVADAGVKNEDGSTTYNVTVTLNNSITNDEIYNDSIYITGHYNGSIISYVHLFAPVGGTISDISSSDGIYYYRDEYLGVPVMYSLDVIIYPGTPITLSYTVTTAPGVEGPLTFSTTPTLQEYR